MDYGIRFKPNEIQSIFNANHNIGRVDLANLLLNNQYASTIREAFDLYLDPSYAKIRGTNVVKSYKECIDLVLSAGGIPVLAHPNQLLLTDEELYQLVKQLVSDGIQGIEVYHSGHTKEQTEYYEELANEFNLIKSGGSDYHGPISKPDTSLGNTDIHSLELVDVLRKRKK